KHFPGNFRGPQAEQMIVRDLAIHKLELPASQMVHQMSEAYLRGIICLTEHGFPKKDLPQGNSIKPSYQFRFGFGFLAPYFNRMREPHLVNFGVSGNHGVADPGPVGITSGGSTVSHDLF